VQLKIQNKCSKLFSKRLHRRLVNSGGGEYIRGEQCAMHLYVGTLQWAGTCALKSGPPSNTWFLEPTSVSPSPKQHLDLFGRFLHSLPVCSQHRHTDRETHRLTDHATCDIFSNRSHLRTARR